MFGNILPFLGIKFFISPRNVLARPLIRSFSFGTIFPSISIRRCERKRVVPFGLMWVEEQYTEQQTPNILPMIENVDWRKKTTYNLKFNIFIGRSGNDLAVFHPNLTNWKSKIWSLFLGQCLIRFRETKFYSLAVNNIRLMSSTRKNCYQIGLK